MDGTAERVRWRGITLLKLHVTGNFKVQEDTQKAKLAKSLLSTTEWTFFESLKITNENSMLLGSE
jgi:hypothetical protein